MKFLNMVMKSPDQRVIDDLYTWMEKYRMPVNEEGMVVAYKRVASDFTSFHDGKTENKVGTWVSIPRKDCDSNPNNDCSRGLHFCSFDYLKSFYGDKGVVVILHIDPADIVSFPKDYNGSKGRTCRYFVSGVHQSKDKIDTLQGQGVVSKTIEGVESFVDQVISMGGRKDYATSAGLSLKKFGKMVKEKYGTTWDALKKQYAKKS